METVVIAVTTRHAQVNLGYQLATRQQRRAREHAGQAQVAS